MFNSSFREMTRSGTTALINEQILKTAPSVFATAPHSEVSDRYGFMPTIDVIDALRGEGWYPVDATQKNVRDQSKRELTTHLVRFRRLGNDLQIGDSVAELVLKNSHDRSSAFVLHAGLFRMVCANGIITADSTFQKLSVRHGKNVVNDIIEGSYNVIENVPAIVDSVESMQNTELSASERAIFARTAYNYANGYDNDAARDEALVTDGNVLASQILRPKRGADTGSDLWTTFNVVQEKLIKGGVRTAKVNDKGQYRRNTSRNITSIDKNIKLNKAIWEMAAQMDALKNGGNVTPPPAETLDIRHMI